MSKLDTAYEKAMEAARLGRQRHLEASRKRVQAAKKLAPRLIRPLYEKGKFLHAQFEPVAMGIDEGRVVFKGGKHGEHSIFASVSDRKRILAHWEGYQRAGGDLQPYKIGDTVSFHGPYSRAIKGAIQRIGKIVKFTGTRALVAFKYRSGAAGQKWLEAREIWHWPRR